MEILKVCDELDLKFGRCINDTRTVLKEKGITEPTSTQQKDS